VAEASCPLPSAPFPPPLLRPLRPFARNPLARDQRPTRSDNAGPTEKKYPPPSKLRLSADSPPFRLMAKPGPGGAGQGAETRSSTRLPTEPPGSAHHTARARAPQLDRPRPRPSPNAAPVSSPDHGLSAGAGANTIRMNTSRTPARWPARPGNSHCHRAKLVFATDNWSRARAKANPRPGNALCAASQPSPGSGNPSRADAEPAPRSGNPCRANSEPVPRSGNPLRDKSGRVPSSGNPLRARSKPVPRSGNPSLASAEPVPRPQKQGQMIPNPPFPSLNH
jgi:hypothetical protein